MLENADFIGLFTSKPMIPDCIHNDNLEFYFYNRNGEFSINVRNGTDNPTMLFVGNNFGVISADNMDTFQLNIEELDNDHPYKNIHGKLYIRVPEPRAFKVYLNEYGWRYFEKID